MYYQRNAPRKTFAAMQFAAICSMAVALATASVAHAQCVNPPTGTMVAWYPFDETAGPTSANLATQNTGVWTSSTPPTPVPGVVGNALNFNGNSYIDTPDSIVTNFGLAGKAVCGGGDYSTCQGDFSMDAWVNIPIVPPLGEFYTIIDKRSAMYTRRQKLRAEIGYWFFILGNSIGVQLAPKTGWAFYESQQVLAPGGWHHVAVTIQRPGNPNGLISFYVDGAPAGTAVPDQNGPGSLLNDVPLRIGALSPDFEDSTAYFNGSLDELQLFNRALTASEVLTIFNAGSSGQCKP